MPPYSPLFFASLAVIGLGVLAANPGPDNYFFYSEQGSKSQPALQCLPCKMVAMLAHLSRSNVTGAKFFSIGMCEMFLENTTSCGQRGDVLSGIQFAGDQVFCGAAFICAKVQPVIIELTVNASMNVTGPDSELISVNVTAKPNKNKNRTVLRDDFFPRPGSVGIGSIEEVSVEDVLADKEFPLPPIPVVDGPNNTLARSNTSRPGDKNNKNSVNIAASKVRLELNHGKEEAVVVEEGQVPMDEGATRRIRSLLMIATELMSSFML